MSLSTRYGKNWVIAWKYKTVIWILILKFRILFSGKIVVYYFYFSRLRFFSFTAMQLQINFFSEIRRKLSRELVFTDTNQTSSLKSRGLVSSCKI